MPRDSVFLLTKYFHLGWLSRRYYNGKQYIQLYSAEDRLRVGKLLYADFLRWKKGVHLIRDYDNVKVDVSFCNGQNLATGYTAERFRRALRAVSKVSLPVVYKIVLNEEEIKAPHLMSAREKLYFNDEIKGLLCRGLDELIAFYKQKSA